MRQAKEQGALNASLGISENILTQKSVIWANTTYHVEFVRGAVSQILRHKFRFDQTLSRTTILQLKNNQFRRKLNR